MDVDIDPEQLFTEKMPKNYAQPDVLNHTFDLLSNLHKLLPNHLVEVLHSYRSEEDKNKCEKPEFSGLEKILARHQLPKEISLSPKPSLMPSWRRRIINNISGNWKKCHLWQKSTYEPPMGTIVARWTKKNLQPTEDLKSVIQRLSALGPIISVTPSGRQSAVVVFRDITSACKAVSAFQSMSGGSMFQCSWQHRFMAKNKTWSRKCTSKVHLEKRESTVGEPQELHN
ncbi:testis expressed protein 56 isoform X1 [Mus musculus]|uniref:Testis expressed protein 56 n=1 Tax=Mus musculus TaxID=10090 RepID=TEX56_MOUSE|nr:testis expressed protein 56 [Mus musculus]XP_011242631.1 testis expressed protein 56 isoform X1 [Mus musculus]Q497N7.1 RecName: Full=Testis expressed protein 56 [Mus musculus]AAI00451.1 RIKEN cDNA 4933417A18 gene [Mus musculus]AAI45748.1 RIKEN cDNA 4933417A18 gene [Mus musculus]|eukprot:NP_080026.2 uncharacterized protein C6orf201 homolog [Mus musculus]